MTNHYKNVYVNAKYSLLASTKMKPIVSMNVDKCINDYYVNCKTIEEAETNFLIQGIDGILEKINYREKDVDLLILGDLQNQILASNRVAALYNISYLGIYSACASFIEGIIIASNFIKNSDIKVIVGTSSHNLVSEKQFRFPVEYGAIRKRVNTSTCTGSISILMSRRKSNVKIESSTIGKCYETGLVDANDMGSAMAMSCAEVIYDHLFDTKRSNDYYDLILTGDLGVYGVEVMKKYYKKKYNEELNNVIDSGSIFYTDNDIYAGASGPLCIGLSLFDYILKEKKYKKILVVGTGSLHSTISCNLGLLIPSISHAVSLEVI